MARNFNRMVNYLPPLTEVIAAHGLAAKKALGQHFLLDGNITDRIARTAGELKNHTVIEVGPGPGGLTRSLLNAGSGRLVVIEKDERCLAAMAQLKTVFGERLDIIGGDAAEGGEKKKK